MEWKILGEIWLIAFCLSIVTRIVFYFIPSDKNIYTNNKLVQIIIFLYCAIIGGIPVGVWLEFLIMPSQTFSLSYLIFCVISTIIAIACVYVLCFFILGFYNFNPDKHWLDLFSIDSWLDLLSIVVLIVSIIGWFITIHLYNRNIEITTQTVVESQTEQKLLYFCNIPVQNVYGTLPHNSGRSISRGEITTLDNLPYWYLNENGEGTFNSALATASKIVFIDDNQSPYVDIIVYSTQTISKNHNNGTETTTIDETWSEYTFYLPESIMQYNLD